MAPLVASRLACLGGYQATRFALGSQFFASAAGDLTMPRGHMRRRELAFTKHVQQRRESHRCDANLAVQTNAYALAEILILQLCRKLHLRRSRSEGCNASTFAHPLTYAVENHLAKLSDQLARPLQSSFTQQQRRLVRWASREKNEGRGCLAEGAPWGKTITIGRPLFPEDRSRSS